MPVSATKNPESGEYILKKNINLGKKDPKQAENTYTNFIAKNFLKSCNFLKSIISEIP